jgi:hypothetical protein
MPCRFELLAILPLVICACGSSPAAPSDPLSATLLGIGCGEELDGYQCHATMNDGGRGRDVTGFATWSTSDNSIAIVNSVGFVTVLTAGDVAIRAVYRDASGVTTMRVQPGGLRRYYRALSGWATDALTNTKLGDVTVRILDGTNAGRTTATGADGAYHLYDLEPQTFTIRFTKTGYTAAERTFTLPGDRFVSLDVALTR